MKNYEAHPLAKKLPMASDEDLAKMAEDIKKRGLIEPITLLDGMILDGRNRYEACKMAGVEPQVVEYQGKDPLADVYSWNVPRRHLTTSQRAAVAVEFKPMFEKAAKERQAEQAVRNQPNGQKVANLPPIEKAKARDQAAAAMNVSGRSVQDAEYVKEHAPEAFEEVKAGNKTVNAAKKEVKQREEQKDRKASNTTPARSRGSFADWQKLRELFEIVQDAVKQMDDLKVDAQHRIQARSMCEAMSGRFGKLAQKLVE